MKITKVSYGRTIIVGNESFKQEKCWFGWDAEVEPEESPEYVISMLHEMADTVEKEQRDHHAHRAHDRHKRDR